MNEPSVADKLFGLGMMLVVSVPAFHSERSIDMSALIPASIKKKLTILLYPT